jgi:hypothetical protein
MPVVDLPADSLGPKPTKKQMELLKRMAAPGATVRMWVGVSLNSGGAYIDYHTPEKVNHETVNQGDVGKFYDWGWLENIGGDHNGQNYSATERARKVIQSGVTR